MAPLLEPVGLGALDSEVYLDLLTRPRSTAPDVAGRLGQPVAGIRRTLRRLLDAGLVTRLVGTPTRYVPAPPDIAVDALVMRRRQELEQLRADARDLTLRLQQEAPAGQPSELIRFVEGADAVSHHLAQIQLGARTEVLIVDSPPYIYGRPVANLEELVALERGVRYRSLYHAPALDDPTHLQQMLECVAAGEEARALPSVQMKMIIVDQRVAMVPVSFLAAETRTRLLVQASPLLDALVLCFESLWSRATPIGGTAGAAEQTSDKRLLAMLASGMKDRAIARALGVTERTVSRRISELMAELHATTRFQAGLQAARRGML